VFIEAQDDEGGSDNWSYIPCKDPFKSSPTTSFLQACVVAIHSIATSLYHKSETITY